jgi:hypothetical protein
MAVAVMPVEELFEGEEHRKAGKNHEHHDGVGAQLFMGRGYQVEKRSAQQSSGREGDQGEQEAPKRRFPEKEGHTSDQADQAQNETGAEYPEQGIHQDRPPESISNIQRRWIGFCMSKRMKDSIRISMLFRNGVSIFSTVKGKKVPNISV